ncbi:DoxX family protein [Corynebacterium sp. H130]|uniref:DoxX family protein n=1 Tax=Corynebacterium sp. H130 TaxID=3133444 RepID=UPI0030B1EAE3
MNPVYIPLAIALLADAAMSVKPMRFIADCLNGVRFPRQWWWALIYIKILAVTGLIVGLWDNTIGISATTGIVAYFLAASIAHFKAKLLNQSFWINCLGMLIFSGVTLTLALNFS